MGTRVDLEPRVIGRADHGVSRNKIQENALKVLYRLHRADHAGYLVGGAVRDLLLGITPKDYDVATDARPTQIRRLFRNSRIIGRRFRLAHVYFKEGVIEVATFRRDPDPQSQGSSESDLLITDDNVFGSPREDAFRRDFTVNALFYSIADFSVIDYVGGMRDLDDRVMRVIGDPDVRFREDPVRMLRACELAGRLSFTLDGATQEGIERHASEISKAAPARLTEELSQLFRSGAAARSMEWMLELGLARTLLPEVEALLEAERRGIGQHTRLFDFFDRHAQQRREFPEVGLMTALVLPQILLRCEEAQGAGDGRVSRWQVRTIATEAVTPFFRRLGLSKHKVEGAVQAVLGVERMRRGRWQDKERVRLSQRSFFDDAFFLFEALAAAGAPRAEGVGKWRRVKELRPPASPRMPRRRPRRRRRAKGGRPRASRIEP